MTEDSSIRNLLDSISEATLRPHLEGLSTVRHPATHPEGLRRASAYVADRMSEYGLQVRKEPFGGWGETNPNIVGELRGEDPEIVLVGAHYDTIDLSPGGDDNASGVAVMLEAARLLARSRGRRTVRFVGFTLEEEGFLGSEHHAGEIRRRKLPFHGAIVLECVGFTDSRRGSQATPHGLPIRIPDRGNFIGVVGNLQAKAFKDAFEEAGRRYAPDLPVVSLLVPENGERFPDTRRSDHVPFWDLGYPAIFLTDTADFRNPHYHRTTDRLETLDLPFMVSVARSLAATLIEVAGLTIE
jgi:hypothetical protein